MVDPGIAAGNGNQWYCLSHSGNVYFEIQKGAEKR